MNDAISLLQLHMQNVCYCRLEQRTDNHRTPLSLSINATALIALYSLAA